MASMRAAALKDAWAYFKGNFARSLAPKDSLAHCHTITHNDAVTFEFLVAINADNNQNLESKRIANVEELQKALIKILVSILIR